MALRCTLADGCSVVVAESFSQSGQSLAVRRRANWHLRRGIQIPTRSRSHRTFRFPRQPERVRSAVLPFAPTRARRFVARATGHRKGQRRKPDREDMMAITDIAAFAHLTDADIENLALELDAI